jgi:2-polyprenyl-6-hydroxyphenyl methylase / 3-demethylubiquinone-9 3-methyltransferase
MPADNTHYDTHAESWWDDRGVLSALAPLQNPARVEYFTRTLARRGLDPRGLRVLDIGCGGGALAEELARLGCRVTGLDVSARSIDVARRHAVAGGLRISYCVARGESLPYDDESFDVAYLGDVLEHVGDFDEAIDETARVLAPGGICFYDTVNRTRRSRLVLIKLFQEWSWSRFLPPDTHEWDAFITPRELHSNMAWHGLAPDGVVGLRPQRNIAGVVWALRQRQRDKISYAELGRRIHLVTSRRADFMFMGHAVKKATGDEAGEHVQRTIE